MEIVNWDLLYFPWPWSVGVLYLSLLCFRFRKALVVINRVLLIDGRQHLSHAILEVMYVHASGLICLVDKLHDQIPLHDAVKLPIRVWLDFLPFSIVCCKFFISCQFNFSNEPYHKLILMKIKFLMAWKQSQTYIC